MFGKSRVFIYEIPNCRCLFGTRRCSIVLWGDLIACRIQRVCYLSTHPTTRRRLIMFFQQSTQVFDLSTFFLFFEIRLGTNF